MAYDASSGQLAVVHRAEVIHRFIIDGSMCPHDIEIGANRTSLATSSSIWSDRSSRTRALDLWKGGWSDVSNYNSYRTNYSPFVLSHVLNDEGKILKSRTTGTVM